jgi:hypothetical protein
MRSMWRGLTWICALLLHDLTERHHSRCNEVPPMFPALDFTLGFIPNGELDLGLVVYVMPIKVRNTNNMYRRGDIQVRYFSLIRVLTVYPEYDFVLMLTVDLHGNDRSP